jgi:HEPN domain-containing protein
MSPNTADEWIEVANERATDAEAIKKENPTSVGSVYMAGYAIECSLKALLQSRVIPFPTHGKKGHNLKELWEASGFRLSDLQDRKGTQAFFIENWSTDLRYYRCLENSPGLEVTELVAGAKKLSGWIQKQIRRSRRRP